MGACHGAPHGKGHFRLSLRAFDPVLDEETIISEEFGRRINFIGKCRVQNMVAFDKICSVNR